MTDMPRKREICVHRLAQAQPARRGERGEDNAGPGHIQGMLTAPAIDLDIFTPCPAGEVAAPTGPLRQPITGLAAARAAGVDHDQLAEIMTHEVRRFYDGTVPVWWALAATLPAEPGRRWPLETILVDDELQQPLGDIARGFINIIGLDMPWNELSIVLSAPGVFTYVGSAMFAEIESISGGYNIVLNGAGGRDGNAVNSSFVGARFDPAMTLDQRVAAALADAAEYAEYRGLTFTATQRPGRRVIPRCSWVDICGYREGANLIDLKVYGFAPNGRDGIVRQEVRAALYGLVHAYNAPSTRFPGMALDYVLQVNI